jgi:ComF family protein
LWRHIAARCLDALFPENCRVCAVALQSFSRVPVCAGCLNASESFSADFHCRRCRTGFANRYPLDADGVCRLCRGGGNRFDAAYTYGLYDGALRGLVHLFKYGGVASLARPLARHLAQAFPREQSFDFIVPVPMHWARRFSRGYNQAELLSRELARRTAIPAAELLTRKRRTPPQAQLTGAQRRRNLAGAFALARGSHVKGKKILLVDDVFTTGSTVNACAIALKRAGAAHVSVLTLARAERRPSSDALELALTPMTVERIK